MEHKKLTLPRLKKWLKGRPESVQALAREFPIGLEINALNGTWYVIGYTESDQLVVTPVYPSREHYDEAVAARKLICAAHLRLEAKHEEA